LTAIYRASSLWFRAWTVSDCDTVTGDALGRLTGGDRWQGAPHTSKIISYRSCEDLRDASGVIFL
jgi:hypothetical protein